MAPSSFRVPVATLRRNPGERLEVSCRGTARDLTITASGVPVRSELEVDALLESVHGGILVTGTVRGPWEGACRRCLRPVRGSLTARVRELYEEGGGDETYPLSGDQLDLEPLVRDAVVLELPLAPLCREDCAGLCSECGADLNEGDCGCDRAGPDPRWEVLNSLRSGEGEADGGR